MIDRGSLAGTIGAYLTGVAVTSAPWLLTTAVLTSLRLVARRSGTDFEIIERFLTVVYAVTVVLSAPVHVVVSRYTADRLYDHHVEKIGAPLRRATALTLLMFAVTGIVVVALMRLPLIAGRRGRAAVRDRGRAVADVVGRRRHDLARRSCCGRSASARR